MRFISRIILHISLCFCLSGCWLATSLIVLCGGAMGTVSYLVYRDKNVGDSITDTRIKLEILAMFRDKYKKESRCVYVYVNNGLVLLLGYVESKKDIGALESCVWKIRGVRIVKNHIEEGGHLGVVQSGIDCETTYMCKSAGITTKGVKSVNFKIVTFNNVVYILGLYRNNKELQTMVNYIKRIKNVKLVISYAERLDKALNSCAK